MAEDKTLLDLGLEDTPDLQAVEAGEYQLKCTSCEVRTSKNTGGQFIMCRFEIPEIPESKEITQVMMLPTKEDSDKQQIKRKGAIKRCLEAFDIDISQPFNPELMVGATGFANLGVEEDPEYGEQNYVRNFITGA